MVSDWGLAKTIREHVSRFALWHHRECWHHVSLEPQTYWHHRFGSSYRPLAPQSVRGTDPLAPESRLEPQTIGTTESIRGTDPLVPQSRLEPQAIGTKDQFGTITKDHWNRWGCSPSRGTFETTDQWDQRSLAPQVARA